MTMLARLAALDRRRPTRAEPDPGARERLLAKLEALAERRRARGEPLREPTAEAREAIKRDLRDAIRRTRGGW